MTVFIPEQLRSAEHYPALEERMGERRCPQCRRKVLGHPNKKFCNKRCKDRFHNLTNPRGKFRHLAESQSKDFDIREYEDDFLQGWDEHKHGPNS